MGGVGGNVVVVCYVWVLLFFLLCFVLWSFNVFCFLVDFGFVVCFGGGVVCVCI